MANGHYLGCILGICEVRSTLFSFLFSGVEETRSFHFGTKTFGLILAFMKLSWRQNQNGSPPQQHVPSQTCVKYIRNQDHHDRERDRSYLNRLLDVDPSYVGL